MTSIWHIAKTGKIKMKKQALAGALGAIFISMAAPAYADENCPLDKPLTQLTDDQKSNCREDAEFVEELASIGFVPESDANENTGDPFVVRLDDKVSDSSAKKVIEKLMEFAEKDPTREIEFYINTGGGSVSAGFAIYDTMQAIPNDIRTICNGRSMSMGLLLTAAGTEGKRQATPNCALMAHQVSSGAVGNIEDTSITLAYNKETNARLLQVISDHTGWEPHVLRNMMSHNVYMYAEEALEMGFIDSVRQPVKAAPTPQARTAQDLPAGFCDKEGRDALRICMD